MNWIDDGNAHCFVEVAEVGSKDTMVSVNLCPNPNWGSNFETIGVTFAFMIFFHLFFAYLNKFKSDKYFLKEQMKKASEARLIEGN